MHLNVTDNLGFLLSNFIFILEVYLRIEFSKTNF
jgi:hypothetical protein